MNIMQNLNCEEIYYDYKQHEYNSGWINYIFRLKSKVHDHIMIYVRLFCNSRVICSKPRISFLTPEKTWRILSFPLQIPLSAFFRWVHVIVIKSFLSDKLKNVYILLMCLCFYKQANSSATQSNCSRKWSFWGMIGWLS